jgi:hypothetical protein
MERFREAELPLLGRRSPPAQIYRISTEDGPKYDEHGRRLFRNLLEPSKGEYTPTFEEALAITSRSSRSSLKKTSGQNVAIFNSQKNESSFVVGPSKTADSFDLPNNSSLSYNASTFKLSESFNEAKEPKKPQLGDHLRRDSSGNDISIPTRAVLSEIYRSQGMSLKESDSEDPLALRSLDLKPVQAKSRPSLLPALPPQEREAKSPATINGGKAARRKKPQPGQGDAVLINFMANYNQPEIARQAAEEALKYVDSASESEGPSDEEMDSGGGMEDLDLKLSQQMAAEEQAKTLAGGADLLQTAREAVRLLNTGVSTSKPPPDARRDSSDNGVSPTEWLERLQVNMGRYSDESIRLDVRPRRNRSRSRSRGLAEAAAVAGAADLAAHEIMKRRERRKQREREAERLRMTTTTHVRFRESSLTRTTGQEEAAASSGDVYSDNPAYYPQTNNFPPPPIVPLRTMPYNSMGSNPPLSPLASSPVARARTANRNGPAISSTRDYTLAAGGSARTPGPHRVHKLLTSGAKQDWIFTNCTISEDRSGDQERVTCMRLAALSSRGNGGLLMPMNDSNVGSDLDFAKERAR